MGDLCAFAIALQPDGVMRATMYQIFAEAAKI